MARSNRSSRSARPEQPARFADGTAVPPDLLALVPPEPPVTYLGGPEHIRQLALMAFTEIPELEHVVLVTDVLGGVHRIRCFEAEVGWLLEEVADDVIDDIEHLSFPAYLLYLSREGAVPENGPRLWDVLHRMHPEPPFFADALVVSTEREEVRPLEECRVTARPGPRNN